MTTAWIKVPLFPSCLFLVSSLDTILWSQSGGTKMAQRHADLYLELMRTIRSRFDLISNLKSQRSDESFVDEIAAFQGRKILEAVAFGCLVAVENGINMIPKDAHRQYNAEKILKELNKKDLNVIPDPNDYRQSTPEEFEQYKSPMTLEGIPERRITRQGFIKIYKRLHSWAHELNPYVYNGRINFVKTHHKKLWEDLDKMEKCLETHRASIRGEGFICVLRNKKDNQTKVLPISKIAEL